MMSERNPETGERFSNIIEMSNAKMKNWLTRVHNKPHSDHIKYLYLLRDTEAFLWSLLDKFQLPTKSNMGPHVCKKYKGKNHNQDFTRYDYYFNREYMELFSKEDTEFIDANTDKRAYAKYGYFRIDR